MSEIKIIYSDPFLRDKSGCQEPPDDAQFVCSYEVHFGDDSFEEPAFIRRSAIGDELWVADYFGRYGIVLVLHPEGSIETASNALLEKIILLNCRHQTTSSSVATAKEVAA